MFRETFIAVLTIAVMAVAGCLTSCCPQKTGPTTKGVSMPAKTIEEVLKENTAKWMAVEGVEGVAIGSRGGRECIRVFSSLEESHLRPQIPSTVQGYPVVFERTGSFGALDDE